MIDLTILNSTGFSNLTEFLFFLVNYAVSISVVLAVVALIAAGFRFILAIGDEEKIRAATQSLLYALIGLVLVFIAPTVIEFVINNIITSAS